MKLGDFWAILKDAGNQFVLNKVPRLGAALAYYAMLSLAPLLIIAIGIAGLAFDKSKAQQQILDQITGLVGTEGGAAIEGMLKGAAQPGAGTLSGILGFAMLAVGAGGLFLELQDSLNTIWEVQAKPGQTLRVLVRYRFLSISMVLCVAFLLLVSLVVSAILASLGPLLGSWQNSTVGQAIAVGVDLVTITVLFALIYRFLPDAKIAWRDVWLGATITSVLFSVGKLGIGLYLGKSGLASGYGAAGSLVVLLVWLYYAAQVFLFGAELTKAYATRFGSRVLPKSHAEALSDDAKAKQGIDPHPATA